MNESQSTLFEFLKDLNNLENLMPEDKVSNWSSSSNQCAFQIKGLSKIAMKYHRDEAPSKLELVSDGDKPFPFTLSIYFKAEGDATTKSYLEFEGDMNPMLSMMAKKPLENFFNMLADKLKAIHE